MLIAYIIANTRKYCESDWLRGVQNLLHLYSVFNICTMEQENVAFDSFIVTFESLKNFHIILLSIPKYLQK